MKNYKTKQELILAYKNLRSLGFFNEFKNDQDLLINQDLQIKTLEYGVVSVLRFLLNECKIDAVNLFIYLDGKNLTIDVLEPLIANYGVYVVKGKDLVNEGGENEK